MDWSEEQVSAIDLAVDPRNRIVGITGEAGSGKTTLLSEVYEQLSLQGTVGLAAPTGRAAKRITEATGILAKTIHRMMRYSMPEDDEEHGLPAHDKNNPLPYKFVLIDEASMVNEELYRSVVDALPTGGSIRFFGDANQLPPVTGKSPFLDVLNKFPSATLTENFRSDDGVVTAARQVLQGRTPSPNNEFIIVNPGVGNLLPVIDKLVDEKFRTLEAQIITPQNKGKFGTIMLNNFLQQKLNPDGSTTRLVYEDKRTGDTIKNVFRVGDKVLWTKNDYKLNLFNGMIGFFAGFDDDGNWNLEFEDREVTVPPTLSAYDPNTKREIFQYDPRRNLALAYAVTTHKAQGSEFFETLVVCTRSFIMDRSNFYTAITRARDKCTVLFGIGGMSAAMRKYSPASRR